SKHFELIYGSSDKTVFEPGFREMVEAEAESCDLILATHDEALYQLRGMDKLVGPSAETIATCRFKRQTYNALKSESFLPEIYPNIQRSKSCFSKPDNGQGSRGEHVKLNYRDVDEGYRH